MKKLQHTIEEHDNMAQGELFQAETSWFHVFRSMIESGDIARMGPHAVTVYLVIKAHTNFKSGRAFPAMETIVSKSGISLAQVKRSLNTLEELGYITKEKMGRNNVYRLREKVEIQDSTGRPAAVATWDYLPSSVSEAMADLKNVLVQGDLAGAKIVQIEHLQVNFNTALDGGKINVAQSMSVSGATTREEKLEMIRRLREEVSKMSDQD